MGCPLTWWRGGTTLAMVRLLYCDVAMDVRGPCRNPSVTLPRSEAADNVEQSLFLLGPHADKFKAELFFPGPPHRCPGDRQRGLLIRQTDLQR